MVAEEVGAREGELGGEGDPWEEARHDGWWAWCYRCSIAGVD